MGGALRQSDKVARLDLAELVIGLQARILLHHQWISAQTDNKLGTDIKDNLPCPSNEGGQETLPAVRSARVTVSN